MSVNVLYLYYLQMTNLFHHGYDLVVVECALNNDLADISNG